MEYEVFRTKEEKFKDSLKSFPDKDNRPFVRVKVDSVRDSIDYSNKALRIESEKFEVHLITGDSLENINLIDAYGLVYSERGNIRDFNGGLGQ